MKCPDRISGCRPRASRNRRLFQSLRVGRPKTLQNVDGKAGQNRAYTLIFPFISRFRVMYISRQDQAVRRSYPRANRNRPTIPHLINGLPKRAIAMHHNATTPRFMLEPKKSPKLDRSHH
jgi:hypothetical protein